MIVLIVSCSPERLCCSVINALIGNIRNINGVIALWAVRWRLRISLHICVSLHWDRNENFITQRKFKKRQIMIWSRQQARWDYNESHTSTIKWPQIEHEAQNFVGLIPRREAESTARWRRRHAVVWGSLKVWWRLSAPPDQVHFNLPCAGESQSSTQAH